MGDNGRAALSMAVVGTLVGMAVGCGVEPEPRFVSGTGDATTTSTTTSRSGPASAAPEEDPLGGAPALWPFSSSAEVRQWQEGGEGHSPWHLDAEATALAFTTGYLGFTDVDTVVRSDIEAERAEVEVGYRLDGDRTAPAAVLRLVRWGDGPDAPWQVVGTVDETLTITQPEPDARVDSPIRVAGWITGVDESIRVRVRDPDAPEPIGESCCQPAGGENTPWSTTVAYHGASGVTLTVVASTGGHVTEVERFAVAGVRPAA